MGFSFGLNVCIGALIAPQRHLSIGAQVETGSRRSEHCAIDPKIVFAGLNGAYLPTSHSAHSHRGKSNPIRCGKYRAEIKFSCGSDWGFPTYGPQPRRSIFAKSESGSRRG
jgi:hypothetical protein